MSTPDLPVHEANPWSTPLRDLGLTIIGTPLDKVLQDFQHELKQRGITRIEPKFYLSTEWGVPFGTISIAIPFYLARDDLTALQRKPLAADRLTREEALATFLKSYLPAAVYALPSVLARHLKLQETELRESLERLVEESHAERAFLPGQKGHSYIWRDSAL